MVQVNNLTFSYKKSKKQVLSDFSISFKSGKIYGLLGKNGAGKSTLLYLMSGLLTPKSGNVTYHNKDVRKRLPETLQDIFLIPEEIELPNILLKDYVKINRPFYPNFSEELMYSYLKQFEMDSNIKLGALSMGQKKKVFMCFALAANTSLILMDEPTNGLDIPGKSQFRKIIASSMNDNRTIIISTHQVRDIDKALDHVIIMDNSQVLFNESVMNISAKLLFVDSSDTTLESKAIYTLPSVQGKSMMLPNDSDEDSDINLELLFAGVLEKKEIINNIFKNAE